MNATIDLQTVIDSGKLQGRDLSFAQDLVICERKYGRLSPKQAPWVARLIQKANGEEPPRPTRELGDVAPLVELFARPRLKFPKVRLHLAGGGEVLLYRAGDRSSHPGSICVTDGQPYGEGRWYGRILSTGAWQQPPAGVPEDVAALVVALAVAPAETAAAHGHFTGRCCFCSLPLTDERSTAVGYGRTCAGHYGLPWGDR